MRAEFDSPSSTVITLQLAAKVWPHGALIMQIALINSIHKLINFFLYLLSALWIALSYKGNLKMPKIFYFEVVFSI